jgi:RND family efflux transporter MFP subunit
VHVTSPTGKKTRWIIIVLAVIGITTGFFFFSLPVTVQTAKPIQGQAVEAVYATGVVEPIHWSKVMPFSPGRILSITAKEGNQVKKGDLLARLDDRDVQAKIEGLQARVDFLRKDVSRQAKLLDQNFISPQTYDRTRSDLQQAEADLLGEKKSLSDTVIISPMNGVVLRQDGEIGEMVDRTFVLFWVGQPHPLRITADVDEEDIPKVSEQQKVLIKADAFPEQVIEGEVQQITPKGDPINKNYRVRISLPPDTILRIGMTTEVNIIVREKLNALLIPATALVDGLVWVAQDEEAKRRKVQTGIIGEDQVEILSGVNERDLIILNPPEKLKEGNPVRVKK